MEEQKLFQIGEVAKLFHLSVSSLRHYEALGLLTPEHVDPSTNYRYYSVRQFEVLNTIRYLRALDMPLPEIAAFLENRDIGVIEEKLRQQKKIVAEKARELKRIERKIDNRLQQLSDAQHSVCDEVKRNRLKACRLAWVRTSLKIRDFFDMEAPIRALEGSRAEAVVFLGKVGVGISEEDLRAGRFDEYDRIFLVLDEEDHFDGETAILPETPCVSIRFRGGHTDARGSYQKLMSYIRGHGLEVGGFSREITMIDYGITSDTEKFVTEISIPVLPRA
ncbi:MerR family transcriptional regulator [Intestinimonas butyriciproducens]|uniref:MerR family transcriptional regulator n=1 Tax=Intestinimonas butyriciproducens TaxID=1297617 RepID=UPI00195DE2B8|nr:MerR family transcriptional regulator [Intestinimonas butyriciproducens]MBM6976252.1 MerR family transcriptional regulator [Intestinimonas butyriciproducens]